MKVLSASLAFALVLATQGVAFGGEPTPASSPPSPSSPSDKAMAEALFRAAKALQSDNKVTEACAKFAESHRLDPKPGTILNVATCHELAGRTATAWADYAEAMTFAARAHQTDREKFARGRLDDLAKKLSYVTFQFPAQPDLEVLLDGKALSTAMAGTRVPMDPGEHALEARAPGKVTWTSRMHVADGPAERTIVVPPLGDDVAAAPPPAAVSNDSTSPAAVPAQRIAGWVAIGAGAVALGAGAFFGIRTLSKTSTIDEHCVGSHCDDAGLRANDDAKDSATLSTVTFALGTAALVTGIVLLVTAPSARAPSSSRGALVTPGGLGGVW